MSFESNSHDGKQTYEICCSNNLVKFRKQLEEELGMDVDISIIEID